MSENIIIKDGIFYNGKTQEEVNALKSLYPNKDICVHMIVPGEARITVYDKETNQDYFETVNDYLDGTMSV